MKILYLDCISGISGDMVIGALIDAGANPQLLEQELKKLEISSEYRLEWKTVIKNGISSTKFDVILTVPDSQTEHENIPEREAGHEHKQEHKNEREFHHGGHSHIVGDSQNQGHSHRSYKEIMTMIERAGFAPEITEIASAIFRKVGEAEGKIHGLPLEEVHFHEVGAIDSIIDIVGTAILYTQLEIDEVKSSPVPVGSGKIHIDHGIYPVPAPATLEILKGVPIEQSSVRAELTTPTGAAILTVLSNEFCPFPSMKVHTIGYGAGTKNFPRHPNVLRAVVGESTRGE